MGQRVERLGVACAASLLLVFLLTRLPATCRLDPQQAQLRAAAAAAPSPPPPPPPPPAVTELAARLAAHEPLLPADALRRGLSYEGGGERLAAFARKLLAGGAVSVVTLGGSVTQGIGAPGGRSYPHRFFEWLNATFPTAPGAPAHTFTNRGIGGTTSALFGLCAEAMTPEDADFVLVEFAFNDAHFEGFWGSSQERSDGSDGRRGYESLLRRLLALPGRPAVATLAYFGWYYATSDGTAHPPGAAAAGGGPLALGAGSGGLFFESAEGEQAVVAQYYDIPVLSVRNAAYPLFLEGAPGYRVDRVVSGSAKGFAGLAAPPGEEGDYFYHDAMHPAEATGHRALADLVVHLVQRAVEREAEEAAAEAAAAAAAAAGAAGAGYPSSGSAGAGASFARAHLLDLPPRRQLPPRGLPRPMLPGNPDVPTSLCLQQEAFENVPVDGDGWTYVADRPDAPSFSMQKWSWTGWDEGAWLDLVLDTRAGGKDGAAPPPPPPAPPLPPAPAGANKTAWLAAQRTQQEEGDKVTVYIGHLISYEHMGDALVECVANCSCDPTTIHGMWKRRASLTQLHEKRVTQHEHCRLRVTILGQSSSDGHKVSLNSAMVAPAPLPLFDFHLDLQGAFLP